MSKAYRLAARHLVAALATVVLVGGCAALAKPEGDGSGPLAGHTIQLVVPFATGGGYDSYARQLAPELGKQLGAEVVVINQPGAGGLLATNNIWNSTPDGTTITLMNTIGTLGSAMAGAPGVHYQPEHFSYIGRISGEPDLLMSAASSRYDSLSDLRSSNERLRAVASGPGSNEYIDAVVVNAALNLNAQIVTGFSGSGEAWLAVMAGYATMHSRSLSSQLPSVESGDATPLLVIGDQPVPELPEVSTITSVANDENQDIINDHVQLIATGRSLAGPPDMPPDVLTALRTAVRTVVTDPAYITAATESGRPISYASGDEIDTLVNRVLSSSPEYVALLREAFGTN